MELEYEITTEQVNAAARVLRAAGIKTEKLAETLRQAAEVLATAFGVVAEAFNILSDAWEKIEESGVLDIVEEPRARRRKKNRARPGVPVGYASVGGADAARHRGAGWGHGVGIQRGNGPV